MMGILKKSGACFFVGVKERKEMYTLQQFFFFNFKNNNRDLISLLHRSFFIRFIDVYTDILMLKSRLCNT